MANIEQNRKLMVENIKKVRAQLSEGSGKNLASNFSKLKKDWEVEIDKIQGKGAEGIWNKRVWPLTPLGKMDRKSLLKLLRFEMGDKYAKKYLGIKNGDKVRIKYESGDVTGTIDKLQASVDTSAGPGKFPTADFFGYYIQFKDDVVDNALESTGKKSGRFNHPGIGKNRLSLDVHMNLDGLYIEKVK